MSVISHILLVDDDPHALDALRLALSDKNPHWHVTPVSTVEAAKVALQSPDKYYDLVLTDLMIDNEPKGIEVIKLTKDSDRRLEVILYTAHEDFLDRRSAYDIGVYDCVRRNTPGIQLYEELSIKANKALKYRSLDLASRPPGESGDETVPGGPKPPSGAFGDS
jgi:DNA-binding NtrC family response regulator